jgi:hypothetical protein
LLHFFLAIPALQLSLQGDLLVHLMEQPEMQEPPSCLAPHQLQGLLDAATRSSSIAASPHIDVVGEGVLAGQMDRRSLLQLVMAATCMDAEVRAVRSAPGMLSLASLSLSICVGLAAVYAV